MSASARCPASRWSVDAHSTPFPRANSAGRRPWYPLAVHVDGYTHVAKVSRFQSQAPSPPAISNRAISSSRTGRSHAYETHPSTTTILDLDARRRTSSRARYSDELTKPLAASRLSNSMITNSLRRPLALDGLYVAGTHDESSAACVDGRGNLFDELRVRLHVDDFGIDYDVTLHYQLSFRLNLGNSRRMASPKIGAFPTHLPASIFTPSVA